MRRSSVISPSSATERGFGFLRVEPPGARSARDQVVVLDRLGMFGANFGPVDLPQVGRRDPELAGKFGLTDLRVLRADLRG